MTAVWFRVTGRVQGVGFRNYASEIARELDVRGEVWNTREGAVEGRAQGDNTPRFVQMLRNGPGRIDEVVTEPAEPLEYEEFSITNSR